MKNLTSLSPQVEVRHHDKINRPLFVKLVILLSGSDFVNNDHGNISGILGLCCYSTGLC